MLSQIDVLNSNGSTLSLPLQDTTSGYTLKNVDGLDPVKATVVSSSFAQLDGSQYQGARRDNRNIIITVGLEPYFGGDTVKELRTALYAYFMPKSQITLGFYEDGVLMYNISGIVESAEAPLFAKDPEMVISILCFEPNFITPYTISTEGMTTDDATEQTIAYPGTVENGYVLEIDFDRDATNLVIQSRHGSVSTSSFESYYSFLDGDILEISTVPKDKYIILTRDGVQYSILYSVPVESKWDPLWPGNNYVRVFCSGDPIPFTFRYVAKYGGL